MTERNDRTQSHQRRRQAHARAKRLRRSAVVALLGGVIWIVAYLVGWKGIWPNTLIPGVTGLFVVGILLSGESERPRPVRRSTTIPELEWDEEEPEYRSERYRPNAVSEAYNTVESTVPAGPAPTFVPRSIGQPSQPGGQVSTRRLPIAPPAEEQKNRMPPPVPPPLTSRDDLRPILAGYPLNRVVREAPPEVKEEPVAEATPVAEPISVADALMAGASLATAVSPVAVEPAPEEPAPEEPAPEISSVAESAPVVEPIAVADEPMAGALLAAESTPEPEAPLVSEVAPEPTPVSQSPLSLLGALVPPVREEVPPSPPPAPEPKGQPAPLTNYTLPSFGMLPMPQRSRGISDDEILERASLLEHTLRTFGVEAKVIDFAFGPAVTRYELQPGPGVRVNKFTALADDLALALAAEDVRIEAPIPGKAAVGIEVPNKQRLAVPLREVLESPQFRNNPSKLAVAFGKDNAGRPVVGDLAQMPHLLIAGSTGSGKSVCMNTIICSLLFKARPDEVKMMMIDPKVVELSTYNGIPHLTAPVITDVRKAAGFLKGAVKEMEARYELFAAMGVRNIQHYNQMVSADPGPDPEHPRPKLPYIVIFIDELADLMMVAPADVEDSICRLAQMARACGMHLVIATQSPRVDVITGLIKANVPSRIAFTVSSQVDSRVIMDSAGAERLLGKGDMLYHPSGISKPLRAQGAFIDEGSVEELVRFVRSQGEPVFTAEEVAVDVGSKRNGRGEAEESAPASAADAAFPQAVRIVIEHGQASVSVLQRRLRCNYTKAVRLIDMMEEHGYIGPHQGSKPREVLISLPQWQQEFGDVVAVAEDEEEE